MARRAAQGAGTIRKKTINRNGQEYTYWEARVTVGRDPGTGKQVQRSFTGKTQKEVREKMQAVAVALNESTYQEPAKMTVGEWLDIWESEYLESVNPRTRDSYRTVIRVHLKPAFGAVKLQNLQTHQIQKFYNGLQRGGLSPKSIKNFHGVLHKALQQAVELGYLRFNPSSACKLPRVERTEVTPLDNDAVKRFLQAVQGHKFESVYLVTLFTGMREGEVLGLTWDSIDFKTGTITISKQLQKERGGKGEYHLVSPKNGKSRRITPAATVMTILKKERIKQLENRMKSGSLWENSLNLVFTNEIGHNLSAQTVYLHFKKIAETIGRPDARFHDLRHSYAVAAIQSGDDIKTVQENLGHHTAAFTLDVYGHVTEQMKQDSADRMEAFINSISNL